MKKIIFIYIMTIAPLISYGQFDVNKAFEALKQAEKETSLVETSVLPDLSIIRQQYRLHRNGEYFGKNHNPYYGESYSLAVKVSGGTLFLSDVMEPWKRDADYARDNASGNYTPSLYWTYQRPLTETDYKSVNFEITDDNGYVRPMNVDKSLYMHTDVVGDFGLSIDNASGEKKGYVLWAYAPNDVQDSAMVVDFRQVSFSIDARPDSALVKMSPADPAKVIGGIFVTPKYERGGRIQFLLSGVAVRDSSDEWSLQLLCSDDKITRSEDWCGITRSSDNGDTKRDNEKNSATKKKKKK